MYAAPSVVLFFAEHQNLMGAQRAPHIIANAFRLSTPGRLLLFSSGQLNQVFEGNSQLAQAYAAIAGSDINHMMVGLGQTQLDIITLIKALFRSTPPEILAFFEGKQVGDALDGNGLLRTIGQLLRAQGVDWKDEWFIAEPSPEPTSPSGT